MTHYFSIALHHCDAMFLPRIITIHYFIVFFSKGYARFNFLKHLYAIFSVSK
jgi:hypothetical protein